VGFFPSFRLFVLYELQSKKGKASAPKGYPLKKEKAGVNGKHR